MSSNYMRALLLSKSSSSLFHITMMHCKLFSFNVAAPALHYCCFQILFLQMILCASINGDANSTASCSSSLMQCANLGNITYPFWGSASCAASPSYVFSNCTSPSTQAYWDSFSNVAVGVVGSPAVITAAESDLSMLTSIQLSWNKTLIGLGFCAPPFPSTELSLYNIPSSINLTRFPESSTLEFGALDFSYDNTYLLFNCTDNYASDVVAAQFGFTDDSDSAACYRYRELCTSLAANTTCNAMRLQAGSTKEIMLQQLLDSLACSHFIFGIDYSSSILTGQWTTGSIELYWTDLQCQRCQQVNGNCIYDVTFPTKFNHCECSNGVALDFNTQTCDCDGGLLQCNTGAKIGFGVAAIVVVLGILVMIAVNCCCRNLCGMIREGIRVGCLSFIKVTIAIAINVLKKSLQKLQSVSIGPNISLDAIDFDGLTERPMEYSYNSIASATKSFNNLVGEGGFGRVYKGTLTQASSHGGSTQLQIAVKVLEVRSKHSRKQFLNEVITIGRIHHVNVVRLLGFCMQEDHEMLVYEYVVNGSLDRWLFDKKGDAQKQQALDWGQRYAIALGIARGLSYLHEECRHRTVHCDIKPQNVLLDENMHPKIADFGLARLMGRDASKVVTLAKGTPGYMASEFWMGGESQLSTKFDVYSYGMVLLELISGQRNFRHDAGASHCSSFPAMAFKAVMEGDLEAILDARLGITSSDGQGGEAEKEAQWRQIKTAAFVALWCIQDEPGRRPGMSEVVKYLEGGAAVSECPPQPHILSFAEQSTPQDFLNSNCHNECTPLSVGR